MHIMKTNVCVYRKTVSSWHVRVNTRCPQTSHIGAKLVCVLDCAYTF